MKKLCFHAWKQIYKISLPKPKDQACGDIKCVRGHHLIKKMGVVQQHEE